MTLEEAEMAPASRRSRPVTAPKGWIGSRAWPAIRQFVLTKPLGAAGGAVIVLMVLAAIFADVIAPYDPVAINQRLQFSPRSLAHWFGTDEFGRDLFSRIVYGARIALFIGFAASFLGSTGGAFLGVMSAYLGGKTDLILQRPMDVLLAFPPPILALAIVSVLGRSISSGSTSTPGSPPPLAIISRRCGPLPTIPSGSRIRRPPSCPRRGSTPAPAAGQRSRTSMFN